MAAYVAKWPDESGHINFTDMENSTWQILYSRQLKTIENRACPEFIKGLTELNLAADRVPQLYEMNASLKKTNWKMVPVKGTILVDEFFTMLSNREFPVANFIRTPEELDYLKQPDVFHELFGHGPLLMNQHYADFVQWYGEVALTLTPASRKIFSRLFWYTIEFGLVNTSEGVRVYGGGILSSHQETIYSLEDKAPKRVGFDMARMLATAYYYDRIQTEYFVLGSLESLYHLRDDAKLKALLDANLSGEQAAFINC